MVGDGVRGEGCGVKGGARTTQNPSGQCVAKLVLLSNYFGGLVVAALASPNSDVRRGRGNFIVFPIS